MKNDTTNKFYINELVINWHITEAYNYNCTYCFAKWGKSNELHWSLESIEKSIGSNHFDFEGILIVENEGAA